MAIIPANEALFQICGQEQSFEKSAKIISQYLTNVLVNKSIKKMIKTRQREIEVVYELEEAYRKGLNKAGLKHLEIDYRYGSEYDLITKRARQIANEKIRKAGYKGGFTEEDYPPCSEHPHCVVVLRLKC